MPGKICLLVDLSLIVELAMLGLKHLSIKSKLQIMLLIVSLGSIVVVAYLSLSKAQQILTQRIFAQLTSVRTAKADQIETYFHTLRHQLETLSESRMVATAMQDFNRDYQKLNDQKIPPVWDRAIESYYNQEFLPRLSKHIDGTPIFATYRPTSPESRFLQYQYIAHNPNPVGEKDDLLQPKDGSNYSKVHALYHPFFRNLVQRLGYEDLFLIDAETGDVIYSVKKETDFASNLYTGPYRDSNLAAVVKEVRNNPDRGAIQLVDFQFYRPSYNAPAAFMAASIFDGTRRVGILVVQLSSDTINQILTGNQQWKQQGLGETGETYIVGDDFRLRSVLRLLIEQPSAYFNALRREGVSPETIQSIQRLNSSLLLQPIETVAAQAALQGKTGTQILPGYRGSLVLASYAPLNIRGVNWGIISEMALSEAFAPINALQQYLLLSAIIMILLVTLFAAIAAQRFVRPIDLMVQRYGNCGADPLPDGEDVSSLSELKFGSQDELSELAQICNGMVVQIHQKTAAIAEKEKENETLLLNILPRPVMERWRKGEKQIIDQVQQVTVIVVQIVGLERAMTQPDNQMMAEGLNELITLLDKKADKFDVERLNCFGDRYVAVCGLTKPRLDHVKRGVDFAQDGLQLIKEVNQKYSLNLNLRMGIHTGAVTAALIGQKKVCYDIWGETVSIATQLAQQAETDTLRATANICDSVPDLFPFEPDKAIVLADRRTLPTWVLRKTGIRDLISELTWGLSFDDEDSPNRPEEERL
uniref:Adenylate/guanylate cyclase with integral membrane sensor n=1 Tax=Cyanothece sp. (strain PCC 7425 / ATCC 29141) TaxID=395961 RepID=B8HPQ6_CYAP4